MSPLPGGLPPGHGGPQPLLDLLLLLPPHLRLLEPQRATEPRQLPLGALVVRRQTPLQHLQAERRREQEVPAPATAPGQLPRSNVFERCVEAPRQSLPHAERHSKGT